MRDVSGKFLDGHPGLGGRPRGSREGIRSLRRLIDDTAQKMVDEGEFEKWFEKVRNEGAAGAAWLFKNVFQEILRREVEVDVTGIDSVTIRWGADRE